MSREGMGPPGKSFPHSPPLTKAKKRGRSLNLSPIKGFQLSPPVDNPVDTLSPPLNRLLQLPALKISVLCRVPGTERLWIKEGRQPTGRRSRSRIMSSDHGRRLKGWMFSIPPPPLPKVKKGDRSLNPSLIKGFQLSPPVGNPVDTLSWLFHNFLGHLGPVNPSDMRPASRRGVNILRIP